MEWKMFLTVFGTVFVAELGDKTQLSTLLFSANPQASRWIIFVAAALALTATSAIGVAAGGWVSRVVSERTLNVIAGTAFIALGGWTLFKAFRY